ncbi:MAG: N-acetylneuraminate synthase family protein [Bacteroidales bacterium]|jgi:N-acetylneuraminate synthase|nr:N-acetylneuraminate synthase family protein [Bacteroidales bacterium]
MEKEPVIEIEGRKTGPGWPPLVVAEIGINHGGSLETAMQMVDAAAFAGAEIVKHQTHVVDDEMSSHARKIKPGNADISIYEVMERSALDEKEETELMRYVRSKGMIFLSTPFSRAAADRLGRMKVPAFKIGSGECNNYPLIKHIASYGKPVILSTGMNSIESIRVSVDILRANHIPYALMHCTNIYPTPPHLVRLNAITQLSAAFPDAVVGLSDHSVTNYPCIAAVALGASVLERHFTDSMEREGPDIVCSMDTEACRQLIEASRIVWLARKGEKGAVPEEEATIRFAFASVVTIKPVRRGETFSHDNIWVKRPGTGEIPAADFEKILGRKAATDIPDDTQLKREMIL